MFNDVAIYNTFVGRITRWVIQEDTVKSTQIGCQCCSSLERQIMNIISIDCIGAGTTIWIVGVNHIHRCTSAGGGVRTRYIVIQHLVTIGILHKDTIIVEVADGTAFHGIVLCCGCVVGCVAIQSHRCVWTCTTCLGIHFTVANLIERTWLSGSSCCSRSVRHPCSCRCTNCIVECRRRCSRVAIQKHVHSIEFVVIRLVCQRNPAR